MAQRDFVDPTLGLVKAGTAPDAVRCCGAEIYLETGPSGQSAHNRYIGARLVSYVKNDQTTYQPKGTVIVCEGRNFLVDEITIIGDRNQLGVHQDGLENDFIISLISGNSNDIVFEQLGTNIADLDVRDQSNDNQISFYQNGTNDIHIRADGHRNLVFARQDYLSGRGNQQIISMP
mgnify:CR=1 FL=1